MNASPGPSGSTGPAHDVDLDIPLSPALEQSLDLATEQLRDRPLPRSVEIADAVLRRSLATPRPSVLVRGRPPYAFVRVSSTAITAVVRERIDARLAGAAVGRILLDVDREQNLVAMTVELFVQFGVDILALADQSRTHAVEALTGLLGPETADVVPVAVNHVHVSDVTVGDPHLVDPGDE